MSKQLIFMLIVVLMINEMQSGPFAYAACQCVCNAGVVACYASLGITFGAATGGAGIPAAGIACSAA